MKKRLLVFMIVAAMAHNLSACSKPDYSKPSFSDKYLLSTSYGGSGWGEFYECLDGYITICKDGTVDVYMPGLAADRPYEVDGKVYIETLTLTKEQYNAIESAVNLEKLYKLDPEPDWDVCDGGSQYLTIYDENDQILKDCGGYMPSNKQFNEMYRAVFDNLPMDELCAIRDAWIEEFRVKEE